MNITARCPLRVSKRKEKKLEEAIRRQREVAELASEKIPYIPKREWGGRITSLNHIIRNNYPNNNGLYYAHYLYKIGHHISDVYKNWMDDGFSGRRPDFSGMNYLFLCNCGSNELTFDLENNGVQIPLLKEKEKDWFRLRIGKYQKELLSKEIKDSSKIVKKNGRYELHQPIKVPDKNLDYEPKTKIGVDFNFDRLAVATAIQDGEYLDSTFFDEGRKLRHYREKSEKRRSELYEKGMHNRIREIKDREARFVEQILHRISKRIVDMASSYENPVIKIEDTDIEEMRKEVNEHNKNYFKTRINRWPVGQLKDFITYKGERKGIKVEKVEPENTSQKCNKCGELGRRPYNNNWKRFYCGKCDYRVDADFNASMNIAKS